MRAFNNRTLERDRHFLDTLSMTVNELRKTKSSYIWNRTKQIMQEKFPERKMTNESLRNSYRRLHNINNVNQITKKRDDRRMGRITLEKRLLPEIKQKRTVEYLSERLGATEDELLAAVAKLQMQGYRSVVVYREDENVFIHNQLRYMHAARAITGDEAGTDLTHLMADDTLRFAVVSDTHFGNKCADKTALHKFYDLLVNDGIDTVLHVGDITDGHYTNRPTSVLEQDAIGFGEQLKAVVNDYPRRDGITTYFITGNHDYTHMRNGFANIGEAVAMVRPDLVYLGHNFARVWLHDKFDVSMIHPTDGIGVDYTKKIRDIVDRNPERRGRMLLIGHYHKWAFTKHRETYGYLVPSFEKKTGFMSDNNLASEVGGVIFTVRLDKRGDVISVSTEYVNYE